MNAERDEQIRTLYRSGLSLREIGEVVGLSRSRVSRTLKRLGEPTRPAGYKKPRASKPRPTSIPFPDGVSPGGATGEGVCIYCADRFDDGARLLDHLADVHGVPRDKPAERPLRCALCGDELPRTNYAPHSCEKSA